MSNISNFSIDHVVINTRFEMDAAARQFAGLGFQLTDRGYHTLGSINHLMMFDTDYLELIGLPAQAKDGSVTRSGISDAPVGINGLVFKTDDIDQTFSHLQSVDLDGDAPNAFSRPVEINGEQRDASFRTVHVRRDTFAAGRLYFCQHLTPELVWQPQWQEHANGASRVVEVVIVSSQPDQMAEQLSRLVGAPVDASDSTGQRLALKDAVLTVTNASAFADRYGRLAQAKPERDDFFGALVFQSKGVEQAQRAASESGCPVQETARGFAVKNEQFDSILEFVG